ncbi:hypothetical protein [Sphingopyxis indica]|uniref:Uncharacterized protein n=1 Tax=Sphingopyxis indica TaxID=436663 RepID=A0A239DL01_9SPHN|nr:hypothetical protein [Sphingopyxis indica]SNS33097.1 hypothetical protein SAMN06295955_101326 [Sphingopyxis indica]
MMTMKPVPLLALVALAFGSPVSAQDQTTPAPSADGAERISILITYGDEECPETTSDEIVVCAQEPESERYRVPKPLREAAEDQKANRGSAWGAAVEEYDQTVASVGRPGGCSPVGSYGYTGCMAKAMREWFEERRLIEQESADD